MLTLSFFFDYYGLDLLSTHSENCNILSKELNSNMSNLITFLSLKTINSNLIGLKSNLKGIFNNVGDGIANSNFSKRFNLKGFGLKTNVFNIEIEKNVQFL